MCCGIYVSCGEVFWVWGYFVFVGFVVILYFDVIDVYVVCVGVLVFEDGVGEYVFVVDYGCFVKFGIEYFLVIFWVGFDGIWNVFRLLSLNIYVFLIIWNNVIIMNILLYVWSWRLLYRRCNGIIWDGVGLFKSGDMFVLR